MRMFIKLMPDQITRNWEVVKYSMRRAMSAVADLDSDDSMNHVLESILAGKISVWVSARESKDVEDSIDMILTTTVSTDYCSGTRSLLIYTLYSPKGTRMSSWLEGYKTLSGEAKRLGCCRIIGFGSYPKLERVIRKLGAFMTKFVSLELYDDVKETIDESLFEDRNKS